MNTFNSLAFIFFGWVIEYGWFSITGPTLISVGGSGGFATLGEVTRQEPALHTFTKLPGMLALFAGNLLGLFGKPFFKLLLSVMPS